MKSLKDIRVIDLPTHVDIQGLLVAYDGIDDFNMSIRRVFVVRGKANSLRGCHAHKELTQIIVCVVGKCQITCDDGVQKRAYLLSVANQALLVPNGIWAEQLYMLEDTVLIVFCDQPYDQADYIRDYVEYLRFRNLTI